MRAAILGTMFVVACDGSGDAPGNTVALQEDPLAYGSAGSQWSDVELDLGDRSDGAPARVPARLHAPKTWRGGDLPTVVFAHDEGVDIDAYADLANHVASHGFVVVVPQYDTTRPRDGAGLREDLVATLDALRAAPPAFDGLTVLVDRFLVAGHGRGGRQALLGAAADPRVAGAFAVDPIEGPPDDAGLLLPDRVGRITVPVALFGAGRAVGEAGCVGDGVGYDAIFAAAPVGTVLWEVPSAGHDDVLDACADGSDGPLCTVCAPGDDPNRVAHLVRASVLAWAAKQLQADEAYDAWGTTERVAQYLPDAVVRTR